MLLLEREDECCACVFLGLIDGVIMKELVCIYRVGVEV